MAINYDNSTSQNVTNGASFSFTCAANAILFVTGRETITGVTYNGVSLTNIIDFEPSIHDGNQQHMKIWYLGTPASGANTLAYTLSAGTAATGVVSYTGCNITNPEANNNQFSNNGVINTQVATFTSSVSTISNNAWGVQFLSAAGAGQTYVAATGNLRTTFGSVASESLSIIDTGLVATPSTPTIKADRSAGSGFTSTVMVSIKPAFQGSGSFIYFN